MPKSKWKFVWDCFIVFLLLFVSVIVPFRLAFYPEEDNLWLIVYSIIDIMFLIDTILTFFTAVID